MELAIATSTPPDVWYAADDVTIATALDVLAVQAERVRRGR